MDSLHLQWQAIDRILSVLMVGGQTENSAALLRRIDNFFAYRTDEPEFVLADSAYGYDYRLYQTYDHNLKWSVRIHTLDGIDITFEKEDRELISKNYTSFDAFKADFDRFISMP